MQFLRNFGYYSNVCKMLVGGSEPKDLLDERILPYLHEGSRLLLFTNRVGVWVACVDGVYLISFNRGSDLLDLQTALSVLPIDTPRMEFDDISIVNLSLIPLRDAPSWVLASKAVWDMAIEGKDFSSPVECA